MPVREVRSDLSRTHCQCEWNPTYPEQGRSHPANVTEIQSLLGAVQCYAKFVQNLPIVMHSLHDRLNAAVEWTVFVMEHLTNAKGCLVDDTHSLRWKQATRSCHGCKLIRSWSCDQPSAARCGRKTHCICITNIECRRAKLLPDRTWGSANHLWCEEVPSIPHGATIHHQDRSSSTDEDIWTQNCRLTNPILRVQTRSHMCACWPANEWSVTSQQIAEATRKDTTLAKVYDHTLHGWPRSCARDDELYPFFVRKEELSLEDGCIVLGRRVVISSTYTEHLLHELHTMHPGIVTMNSISRRFMWWPGIDSDIEEMVRSWSECSRQRNAPPGHGREYMWTLSHLTVHGPRISGHGREYMLALPKKTERFSWLWQIVTQSGLRS